MTGYPPTLARWWINSVRVRLALGSAPFNADKIKIATNLFRVLSGHPPPRLANAEGFVSSLPQRGRHHLQTASFPRKRESIF